VRFRRVHDALNAAVPELLRFLTPSAETVNFPLRTFYRSQAAQESDALRAYFAKDVTLIHASMAFAEQAAERFYSGYDTGWAVSSTTSMHGERSRTICYTRLCW
jgi:transposase InsO family protein